MDPRELAEIEAIKQLKARYFRLMDTRQWEAWGDVFSEDCHLQVEVPGGEDSDVRGRSAIVAFVSGVLRGAVTVHHGHMPEIELTGQGTARGVWAMFDDVRFEGGSGLRGYGHYHESYEKRDGRWRIKTLRLSRLRVDPIAG